MKKAREMYEKLFAGMLRVLRSEKGQTMIEYALVAILIAIALVIVFRNSGVNNGVSTAASRIQSSLSQ